MARRRWLFLALSLVFVAGGTTAAAQIQEPLPPPRVLDVEPRILDVKQRIQDLVVDKGRSATIQLSADVLFAFDSAELLPAARQQLAGVVAEIDRRGPARVKLTGHTDSIGSNGFNQRLSERRAEAVRAYLRRALSSPASTIQANGRGETEPIAPNQNPDGSDNPAGRAKNRRVTITFRR